LRWAQPLRQGDLTAGVLVISRSSGDIDAVVSQTKRIFLITAIMTGLAGAAAAALIAGRWSRHFAAMRQAVSHLTFDQEKPPSPLAAGSADELQRMAKSVEETRDKIDAQIRGIDQVRRDLQSMLETIPEAVIAIDADQRILFANPSTYRLFGLPATDIAGKKLWAILRQPGLQDAVSRSLATSDQVTTEFEIRNPPRVVSFRGRNLNIGSGRGVIIVLQDVTELRRLERMRRDFFASVSHELKTPLAAIKAYTETLLDDDTGDRNIIERFLHRIEEQADRLHTLVIDMLTLARVESEDHGFDIRPIEVAPTLAASVELFRAEADGKSLRFETHIAPAVILADAEGFGMIVRNLIDNAVKYTPVGGTVTVSSVVDGDSIRIDVADTGVGIPPEDLTRIFERFYRVDKARSRELGGTGLGLSIVKHLVQQFCGTVSVTSRLHEGSVFTVSLPLLEESDESRDQPTTLVQESAS
jgi:two-component system phosphate regulon sensor histidine kinase PhoR